MPMPCIPGKDITIDIKNGFYNFDNNQADAMRYSKALKTLKSALKWRHDTINTGTIDWARVTLSLMHMEIAKVGVFIRLCRAFLHQPGHKVVVFLNYTRSLTRISEALHRQVGVVTLQGSDSIKNRTRDVEAFQTDPRIRVLVTNIRVGAFGMDMHDIVGNSPRNILISPSYNMTEQSQAPGRCWRDGTRSSVIGRIVYGDVDGQSEINIFSALDHKSEVLRAITKRRSHSTKCIPLPSEYRCIKEIRPGVSIPYSPKIVRPRRHRRQQQQRQQQQGNSRRHSNQAAPRNYIMHESI